MTKISIEDSIKIRNMSVLATLMILVIHWPISTANKYIDTTISVLRAFSWMAVPWFALVSGMMLGRHAGEAGRWKYALASRTKSLVIPYFVWCTIGLLPAVMAWLHRALACPQRLGEVPPLFVTLINGYGLGLISEGPSIQALWYVRTLILIVVMLPIVEWIVSLGDKMILLLAIIYLMLFGSFTIVPWIDGDFIAFKIGLEVIVYLIVGYAISSRSEINRFLNLDRKICLMVGILLCVASVILEQRSMWIWHFVRRLAIPFSMIGCLSIMSARQLPSYVYQVTFPIYVMHQFVRGLCYKVIDGDSVIASICVFFVMILVPFIFSCWLSKCLPSWHAVVFGSRGIKR